MTFTEYIYDKLRYFLHGEAPESMSLHGMFSHMYGKEPAMKETMFFYYILQGKEAFIEATCAYDEYVSDLLKRYPAFDDDEYDGFFLFKGSENAHHDQWVKRILQQDKEEIALVLNIVNNLTDAQYEKLRGDATSSFVTAELGFPLRYGKLVDSWRSREAYSRVDAQELSRRSISLYAEKEGISIEETKCRIVEEDPNITDEELSELLGGNDIPLNTLSRIGTALSSLRRKR